MANDHTIKTFTAADIEKYHRGLLSPKEMHDLEKAALDDPFLADALEGYATAGVQAIEDTAILQARLAKRIEDGQKDKVVTLGGTQPPVFRWWKVAAMILVIAGAGFLAYKFAFTGQDKPVAKTEQPNQADQLVIQPKDSLLQGLNTDTSRFMSSDKNDSTASTARNSLTKAADTSHFITHKMALKAPGKDGDGLATQYDDIARKNMELKEEVQTIPALPQTRNQERPGDYEKDMSRRQESAFKKPDTVYMGGSASPRAANSKISIASGESNYYKADNKALQNNTVQQRNIFRGKVTDNNNNAVPFANITNIADNVGTYTDAKGNFVLTSPDSTLNVQVKSVGFENNNIVLRNQAPLNQVVMQEDRKSLSEIVISHKQINSRSRTSNMVLEEPEPIDGWANYDTYVANNLVVPENYRQKQTGDIGQVQLSFEVNKNGEPVNITVDKSLCENCDKEAIRLIKEGPKWKWKKKKGRTSVTISF